MKRKCPSWGKELAKRNGCFTLEIPGESTVNLETGTKQKPLKITWGG